MIDEMCFSTSVLEGAKEVFETMIFMDLEEASESSRQIEEANSLLGLITFKNSIEGCLAIRTNEPCARFIAASMLGIEDAGEISELTQEEICDAFGEVTNMVMGSVKSRIQIDTGELQVSIPTVVCGMNLSNSLGEQASKVVVRVSTENEDIIEFSFLYRISGEGK